jgi:hypothetical protein
MKLKNIFATSVIVFSASLWAESAKAFLLIDNFDTVDQSILDSNGSGNTNPTSATGTGLASDILGTVRDIQALAITGSPPATITRAFIDTAGNTTPFGVLQFSTNGGSSSSSFRVDYDGTAGFSGAGSGITTGITQNGLSNINFIQGDPINNVGIVFDIIDTNDLGVGSFATLTAYTTSGTVSGFATVNNIESLTAINNLVFLFSNFSGGLDFTQVGALSLSLTINPLPGSSGGFKPASISFEQVQIAQIPFEFSPAIGVGLLSGLYGLNQLRKKMSKPVK